MTLIRKLYDWVLHWATTRYAIPVLFVISFVESSFFPIPPDILLIAMVIAAPAGWVRLALICSIGSVLGGMFGYLIGYQFMDLIGNRIVEFYHFQEKWGEIGVLYDKYDVWAVIVAGFTPLPYKVFTLSAGAFKINFSTFVLASAVSRAARFFLIAALLYKFGPPFKVLIEKYFNLFTIIFSFLLVFGFFLLKVIL
jgi:membrane protein YqaA with SNARE-associated domain